MAARHGVLTSLSAALLVGSVLVAGSPAADQTAGDLLKAGLTQLDQGKLVDAKTTLERVDPVQLDKDQRQQLQQALLKIQALQQEAAAKAAEAAKPAPAPAPTPEPQPEPVAAPTTTPTPAPAPVAKPDAPVQPVAAPATPQVKPTSPAPAPAPAPAPSQTDLIREAATLTAQQRIAQADEAAKSGQWNSAARLYQRALDIDPANITAKQGLENARTQLARNNATTVVGEYGRVYELRHSQTVARYDDAMRSANDAVKAARYREAEDASALAKAVIDTNRQFLSEAEYSRMSKAVLDFNAQMAVAAEHQRAHEIAVETGKAHIDQVNKTIRAEHDRQRKVQELLRRAADLRRDLNYDQALDVLDQVLFLDPHNVAAQAMKEMIEDNQIYRNQSALERQRGLNIAKFAIENYNATIPPLEIIQYPPDWPQLTNNRLAGASNAAGDSDANRRTMEKLKQPIPISFDANRFENVVEYLRNVTGVNFFVNWKALQGAGIEPGNQITLQLANVPADKALRLILDQLGGDLVPLGYNIDDGVVTISTNENLGKNTTIRTYDIRDLLVQAPNFNDAPNFDLVAITQGSSDRTLGGGGGGSQQTQLFKDTTQNAATPGRTELIQQIMDLLTQTVDPDGWRKNGGLVSSMSELNGSLIINTTSANHRAILSLLGQLRETRALQINVEARFLLVTQNYLDEVGVDLDLTISGLSKHFSPITIDQESATIADRTNTGITGSFGATNPGETGGYQRGMVVSGSYLNDVQVDLLVRATEANRQTISLSAPRLTFFNGQRAYVMVSTQLAFISDLTPAVGTGAVAFQPHLSVVSSGIILDIEGTVSADRRYVTMTARPSLANIIQLRSIQISAQSTDVNTGINGSTGSVPQTVSGSIEAPEIEITTLRTTVSVPDKGTLLMGGQRLYADVDVEAGVPVLSQIPYLNRLFTNRSTVKDERTLLILIKPTIIIQSEKENELFPGLNQSPELFTPATTMPTGLGGGGLGAGAAAAPAAPAGK